MTSVTIEKCAAIIIRNKKLLLTKKKNTDIFISPGGKINSFETREQCLLREIREELGVNVSSYSFFETFCGLAAFEKIEIKMHTYIAEIDGQPIPNSEIESLLWYSPSDNKSQKIGSMFNSHVIPYLKSSGLIE